MRTKTEWLSAACLPFLKAEIDIVQPKHIVAMGSMVVEMLGKLSPSFEGEPSFDVGRAVGWSRNIKVLMTNNISLAIRSPHWQREFWDALGSFADLYNISAIH